MNEWTIIPVLLEFHRVSPPSILLTNALLVCIQICICYIDGSVQTFTQITSLLQNFDDDNVA